MWAKRVLRKKKPHHEYIFYILKAKKKSVFELENLKFLKLNVKKHSKFKI